MKKVLLLFITIILMIICSDDSPSAFIHTNETDTNSMTKVARIEYPILSKESNDKLTLYTSAAVENDIFMWDDSAHWVIELENSEGLNYTIYNTHISNGSLYFDLMEINNNIYILVRNISTAANYTKVFMVNEGKICETTSLDLNNMSSQNINLIYTSIPIYKK